MSEKRRLLLVSHEMTLSGAPIQLAYLAQWLQGRGWDVRVLAPEPGPLTDLLGGIAIDYDSQLLIDPAYGALRHAIPAHDLVIANTVATWEAVQAARLEHRPALWYIHETEVGIYLMNLVHMIQPTLAFADAVIVPTETTRAIYQPHRTSEIEIVPYGIPVPSVSSEAEPRQRDRAALICATIGTYEPRKGQDLLLEAIDQLPARVREQARFQCAGRPLDTAFHESLQTRASTMRNVELLEPLDHTRAIDLLAAADILILPSRDETMPLVLLEAMALGKPIVATDVGGIAEWLDDRRNALVVPREDAGALASAIYTMLTDGSVREQTAAAAKATYERFFTIEQYGRSFETAIRRVLAA